jgi:hypothetical protein
MDIAILITEYLADKSALRDPENDSLNIVDNQIASWSFTNIPIPTAEDLAVCEAAVIAKQSKAAKLAQIAELEAQLTPRRIREAVLSGDNTFIAGIDAQIAAIRATLE